MVNFFSNKYNTNSSSQPATHKTKKQFFFVFLFFTEIQLVSNPKAKQDCQMVHENNTERPVEFYLQCEKHKKKMNKHVLRVYDENEQMYVFQRPCT